jgi:hypothetical protein
MRTQMEKAEAFRALHARPGAFIIPNPWDAGTAKLLAASALPIRSAEPPSASMPSSRTAG